MASGEALFPALAGCAGVVAAAVFIAKTNDDTKQGEFAVGDRVEVADAADGPWLRGVVTSLYPIVVKVNGQNENDVFKFVRKEGTSGDTATAVTAENANASAQAVARTTAAQGLVPPEKPAVVTTPAQRQPTSMQAEQMRGAVKKLPPKTQEALDKWIKLSETDRNGMIALNLLVCVLFLGIAVMVVVLFIGFFQVNVFELETYKNWRGTLKKMWTELNKLQASPAAKKAAAKLSAGVRSTEL